MAWVLVSDYSGPQQFHFVEGYFDMQNDVKCYFPLKTRSTFLLKYVVTLSMCKMLILV